MMVKIRHWQLFIILFLLPVVVMFSLPDEVVLDNSPQGLISSVIIMAIYLSILLFWVLSLGYKLYKRKPLSIDLKREYFLFLTSLIIIVAYMGLIFWTIINSTPKKDVPAFLFPTLIVMSFFEVVCVFYCWKFIAKTLKIVELNRAVARNEWFSDAVIFSCYPVGMWNLQPRVNKIFEKSSKPA